MGRCLRPCQQAVGVAEYRSEAERVAEFLKTSGRSLIGLAESARERLSAEMDFEGAALMTGDISAFRTCWVGVTRWRAMWIV